MQQKIPKPITKEGLRFTFKFSHWGLYVSMIRNKQGQIFSFHLGQELFIWCKNTKCYISTKTQHQLYYTDISKN